MKLVNKTLAMVLFLIMPAQGYVEREKIIEDRVFMQRYNRVYDCITGEKRMDVMIYEDLCNCKGNNLPQEEHVKVIDWRYLRDSKLPTFDPVTKTFVAEFYDRETNTKRRVISDFF